MCVTIKDIEQLTALARRIYYGMSRLATSAQLIVLNEDIFVQHMDSKSADKEKLNAIPKFCGYSCQFEKMRFKLLKYANCKKNQNLNLQIHMPKSSVPYLVIPGLVT